MSSSENSAQDTNTFNISESSITNLSGSGNIYYNAGKTEQSARLEQPIAQQNLPLPQRVILILSANPYNNLRLRLDEEIREIDAGLRQAKRRDQFVLEQRWAVRARDLQRAMLECKPQIVHFAGHGESEVGLMFEEDTGQAKLIDAEMIAALFELFADRLECVVLNACYSEAQAKAIRQYIPHVIGMPADLGERAAIEFAVGFYDAIGAGESYEFAYKLGCSAMRMAGVAIEGLPVMQPKL